MANKKAYINILNHQIMRLAKIYTCRPVKACNLHWHNRVAELQVGVIKEKRSIMTGGSRFTPQDRKIKLPIRYTLTSYLNGI